MKVWQHIIRASVVIRHWTVIVAIGILVYYVVDWGERLISHFETPALVNQVAAPKDTTIVQHITNNRVTNITYPAKVEKEAKPDAAERKQAEKGTIITGEEIKNGKLIVDKIDSAGNKTQDQYAEKPTDKVTIDKDGKVDIEKDKKAERKEKTKEKVEAIKWGLLGVAIALIIEKLSGK